MISYSELINNPSDYQPLHSVKGVQNVPNRPDFTYVDLEEKFLCSANIQKLATHLYEVYRQNGGQSPKAKFSSLIPKLVKRFARNKDLNLYSAVENAAFGFQNWQEELAAINADFIKSVYGIFRWNVFVPTREWAEVGDSENRRQVRFSDLQAEDIPTINVWKEQKILIKGENFRDNNKIPVWRTSIHTRHYDRSDLGSGYKYDLDHSSRETLQRGFDMSNINSLIDKWQSSDWFGM